MIDWLFANKSYPNRILIPNSCDELVDFLRNNECIISIAGAQFSSGGQTLNDNGVIILFNKINGITDIDINSKEYTVESGCTWEEVLKTLTKYFLVPLVMQSYNSFTIGGSISVNGHGRSGKRLSDSIVWMDIILVDGKIKRCSRTSNRLLFYSIIGGYGLIGIIWRARLKAQSNKRIICNIVNGINDGIESAKNLQNEILYHISQSPILYNCAITNNGQYYHCIWNETDTIESDKSIDYVGHTQNSTYGSNVLMRFGETLISMFPSIRDIFQNTRPLQLEGKSVLLSHEMGYSAKDLLPITSSKMLQSLLQEYFLPVENVLNFHENFISIINRYDFVVLNTSIRYIENTPQCSFLDYTNFNSHNKVAIVYYINIANFIDRVIYYKNFTYEIIELVLSYRGTWHLTYYPAFTRNQLLCGYPFIDEFLKLKKKYDPSSRLHSKFYEYILSC